MITLTRIDPHELTKQEVCWLLRSILQANEFWEDISRELVHGRAQAWRITGTKTQGAMVTQELGNVLFIWHLGGAGFWRVTHGFLDALQAHVAERKLDGIEALTLPSIARFLERHGFSSEKILVEWRVQNGRK